MHIEPSLADSKYLINISCHYECRKVDLQGEVNVAINYTPPKIRVPQITRGTHNLISIQEERERKQT